MKKHIKQKITNYDRQVIGLSDTRGLRYFTTNTTKSKAKIKGSIKWGTAPKRKAVKEELIKKLKKQAKMIGGKDYPYAVVDIRELDAQKANKRECEEIKNFILHKKSYTDYNPDFGTPDYWLKDAYEKILKFIDSLSDTRVKHDYENNGLGGVVCKGCGKFQSVPDFPPYCDTKVKEDECLDFGLGYELADKQCEEELAEALDNYKAKLKKKLKKKVYAYDEKEESGCIDWKDILALLDKS